MKNKPFFRQKITTQYAKKKKQVWKKREENEREYQEQSLLRMMRLCVWIWEVMVWYEGMLFWYRENSEGSGGDFVVSVMPCHDVNGEGEGIECGVCFHRNRNSRRLWCCYWCLSVVVRGNQWMNLDTHSRTHSLLPSPQLPSSRRGRYSLTHYHYPVLLMEPTLPSFLFYCPNFFYK